MRIGILGTGVFATALATAWARAGHEIAIGGRSSAKAEEIADRLGPAVQAVTPREAITDRDAVLLAVSWDAVEPVLRSAGAADGLLDGTPLIDPTNAVEHGIGNLLTEPGDSIADRIAVLAPGAHVVKAFHMFAGNQWTDRDLPPVTVAMCGDDPAALKVVGELVRSVGGVPAVLGPLARVRQLEEVAGFVIGLVFAGVDPSSAIPQVPARGVSVRNDSPSSEPRPK